MRGDAVDDLPAAVEALGACHPVVHTSWVLKYLPGRRTAFLARLEELGAQRDLTWICVEAPMETPDLPFAPPPGSAVDLQRSALVVVRWRAGERTVEWLATCQPHGAWVRGPG